MAGIEVKFKIGVNREGGFYREFCTTHLLAKLDVYGKDAILGPFTSCEILLKANPADITGDEFIAERDALIGFIRTLLKHAGAPEPHGWTKKEQRRSAAVM